MEAERSTDLHCAQCREVTPHMEIDDGKFMCIECAERAVKRRDANRAAVAGLIAIAVFITMLLITGSADPRVWLGLRGGGE